jgi:RimJ/RimL family protein N-acetyltransferase
MKLELVESPTWDDLEPLLKLAEVDPNLTGFVYPQDRVRRRVGLYRDEALVGFFTPRQDPDEVWRMGAIFIVPEHRGLGLASLAIRSFMRGKLGRAFISDGNVASARAYAQAGFKMVERDEARGGSWWSNAD